MKHYTCKLVPHYNQLVNRLYACVYLVDPASSYTLVLKIKPCMSKCFDDFT